jgi:hypothetical protein
MKQAITLVVAVLLAQAVVIGESRMAKGTVARAESQAENIEQKTRVAWQIEFDDAKDLESLLVSAGSAPGVPAPKKGIAEIEIRDGRLRVQLHLGEPDTQAGQTVTLAWGRTSKATDPQPPPLPLVDVNQFPLLEFRCRVVPAGRGYANGVDWTPYWTLRAPDGRERMLFPVNSASWHPTDEWQVFKLRLVPDGTQGGSPLTPRLTGISLVASINKTEQPLTASLEVDYVRVRALTEEEARIDVSLSERFRGYRRPPVPKRVAGKFFYGVLTRPPYAGGWEGVFDQVVRSHMNMVVGVQVDTTSIQPFPCYTWGFGPTGPYSLRDNAPGLREVAKAAEARGVSLIVTPNDDYVARLLTLAEPIEGLEKSIGELVSYTKNLPSIIGWYLIEEPAIEVRKQVVAVKGIFERLDPDRLAYFPLNSPVHVREYEQYLTVVVGDHYPITISKRDPWDTTRWLREISKISSRPQWYEGQSWGSIDATDQLPPDWGAFPTPAEFRLMMYLALANGAKGFRFDHYCDNYFHKGSLVDPFGNPGPLMEEATRLGEKWSAIGPLLLGARPILKPEVLIAASPGAKRGISVGAMGDPAKGPVFLVATNEDLTLRQGGKVSLPPSWADRQRAVFDLYDLKKIAAAGATAFDIEVLEPGDGRIYLLGSQAQFEVAKQQILTNQVEEILRAQGADQHLGLAWGLDLAEYAGAARAVRKNLTSGQLELALRDSSRAGQVLEKTLRKDAALVASRELLASIQKELGKAYQSRYRFCYELSGYYPRPGQEKVVEPFKELSERYDRLRRDYFLGRKTNLFTEIKRLQGELKARLAD